MLKFASSPTDTSSKHKLKRLSTTLTTSSSQALLPKPVLKKTPMVSSPVSQSFSPASTTTTPTSTDASPVTVTTLLSLPTPHIESKPEKNRSMFYPSKKPKFLMLTPQHDNYLAPSAPHTHTRPATRLNVSQSSNAVLLKDNYTSDLANDSANVAPSVTNIARIRAAARADVVERLFVPRTGLANNTTTSTSTTSSLVL